MSTQVLNRKALVDQLEGELKLLDGNDSVDMWLSNRLGNEGKYCTLTKECMPSCN